MTPGAGTPLSQQLREATSGLHREVERGPGVQCLLRGQFGTSAYARLLAGWRGIYHELESALSTPPAAYWLQADWRRAVARSLPLESDLAALMALGAEADPAPLPAARAYANHLRQLAANQPCRLLAHAYVRHLGDLSGGQVLAGVVARTLGGGAAPVAFYDHGPPARVRELAQQLRAMLDAAPLGAGEREAVVDEARRAFEAHAVLYAQWAGLLGR